VVEKVEVVTTVDVLEHVRHDETSVVADTRHVSLVTINVVSPGDVHDLVTTEA
jgi:hypothetical protein